jgi:uncharacterized protein (DUF1015 family)
MSEIELHEKTLEEKKLEKKTQRIASNRKYYLKTHPIRVVRQSREELNNYLRSWRANKKALKNALKNDHTPP